MAWCLYSKFFKKFQTSQEEKIERLEKLVDEMLKEKNSYTVSDAIAGVRIHFYV